MLQILESSGGRLADLLTQTKVLFGERIREETQPLELEVAVDEEGQVSKVQRLLPSPPSTGARQAEAVFTP